MVQIAELIRCEEYDSLNEICLFGTIENLRRHVTALKTEVNMDNLDIAVTLLQERFCDAKAVFKSLADHSAKMALITLLKENKLDVKDAEIEKWLIEALMRATGRGDIATVETLCEIGAPVNGRGWYSKTALHMAVFGGRALAEYLVRQAGADVNVPDILNDTALHKAVTAKDLDMVKLFCNYGSAEVDRRGWGGQTALFTALRHDESIAEYLIKEAGADVNIACAVGETPLHYAAKWGWSKMVKLLCQYGAQVDKRIGIMGRTALQLACCHLRPSTAEYLIGKGADINIADVSGDTSLHDAAFEGHCDRVSLLCRLGAEVNKKGSFGQTPLHFASMNGHADIVDLLLESGADSGITDDYWRTALDAAGENCYDEGEKEEILSYWDETVKTKKGQKKERRKKQRRSQQKVL